MISDITTGKSEMQFGDRRSINSSNFDDAAKN